MGQDRYQLLRKLEDIRQSNIICYIAGDRQNVSTRIAPDIIPVFHRHLENIKNHKKIDLFMYTKGGDVLTALRLVELIYEYTDQFSVIIPYKSYSAGTLISLGASEIVMTKMGELSPVDPNVTSTFNPKDPNNPSVSIPINVEDVFAFFSILDDVVKIKDDDALSTIITKLIEHIHPLSLGSIQRTYSLIRSVTRNLLLMQINPLDESRINHIVDHLTQKLFSHSYMISRREAKDELKLPVTYPTSETETLIWDLFTTYQKDLQFEQPFVPENHIDREGNFSVVCGVVESEAMIDEYVFQGVVQNNIHDPNAGGSVNIIHQGWNSRYAF